jgi:formate dehydrogenase major subunit
MIKLTIDGQTVEVPEGTTVLKAARQMGIEIPTLCDHPQLTPYGGCRLCIVEIDGFRVPQTSCTIPCSNGMNIRTQTPALNKSREFILSMLFSERNHFCPFCQVSGGDCELQNAAYDQEMTHWPFQPAWKTFPVDASHPYYVLDNNRCILCRRCVRACGELVGNFTLGMEERGTDTMLVADVGVPLNLSTCIQCGTCVQVCPTGALIDRQSAYQGLDDKTTRTASVCQQCSVGCSVEVVTRDNRLIHIDGDWAGAVNGGVLCKLGRYQPIEEKRARLTQPQIKRNGKLEPATWDEAIKFVADRVKPLNGQGDHGLAALASTRLSVEALSAFKQLFADGLKSDLVTAVEEGLPTARAAAYADQAGPFEAKLDALKTADCVIAIGVNLARSHQVAGFFVKRNQPKGSKLIVIDPGENELDALADVSIKTNDLEALNGLLAKSPQFAAAAELIGAAKQIVIVYGKGVVAYGEPAVFAKLIELAKSIGAQLIGVKGEANSFAAAQLKLDRPFALNGHQAVYVAMGDDFVTERLMKRLEKAPFLVAQASYASKLTDMADVVLPVEMWAEQDGHFVNLEGRVQAAHKALTAPGEVKSNVDVLRAVAVKLGLETSNDWQAALKQRVPVSELIEA